MAQAKIDEQNTESARATEIAMVTNKSPYASVVVVLGAYNLILFAGVAGFLMLGHSISDPNANLIVGAIIRRLRVHPGLLARHVADLPHSDRPGDRLRPQGRSASTAREALIVEWHGPHGLPRRRDREPGGWQTVVALAGLGAFVALAIWAGTHWP